VAIFSCAVKYWEIIADNEPIEKNEKNCEKKSGEYS
jgi:hypothetical protein